MSDNAQELAERQACEPVTKDRAHLKEKRALSFDEQLADLGKLINFEPLIREIDYKILAYCVERRGLSDIEQRIASFPEFKGATRDQYHLITELVHHHGLQLFELDAAGEPVTPERKEGLTENEIDDLVAGFAYETTDVGKLIVEQMDPMVRLRELLDAEPQRQALYESILDYLGQKHSFAEVDVRIAQLAPADLSRCAGDGGVQSSVFVDKLERAGGLFYDGGWQTSEAGASFLAARRASQATA